jgi:signal transduction histidine kinase
MRCPRCKEENPAGQHFCGQCGTPLQRRAGAPQTAASYAELQRALSDALEQQTATSEILRVIASSPTEIQPVLDTIAESAARVCGANDAVIYRIDHGEVTRIVAVYGPIAKRRVGEQGKNLIRGSIPGRAMLERRTVHVHDIQSEEGEEFPFSLELQRQLGNESRTMLSTPLLREGASIGAILIRRAEVRPFTEHQIELLQTFADQAVIAIENVRLFTELQEKNEALTAAHAQVTDALDRQTATSEILRVIGSSPTDAQPVFETIARSGVSVCAALGCVVLVVDGDTIRVAATHGVRPERLQRFREEYPLPIAADIDTAQTVRERRVFHLAGILHNPDASPADIENARLAGYQTRLMVPMVRGDRALGLIAVTREAPTPFSDQQVELLQTFAEQAVIAIENVRLFTELQARTHQLTRSVEQLTALGEVGQAITSTLDLQTVLSTIVTRATQLTGVDAGVIYEYDEAREVFEPRATERLEQDIVERLEATPVRKGQGATGRLADAREPIQVSDLRDIAAQIPARVALVRAGYRAVLAVPLIREDHLIGGLTVFRKTPGMFASGTVDLLRTFATQSALAIQNARLFHEIADKSRQLEIASQHKSEFLANMSHELRTPLNAVIGFSEVLRDRMFGDLNEKQEEYLNDIHASGQHLLSLINDILDLSKIEAGRMELDLADFHLPAAIDDALLLMRERAGRRGLSLERHVDERLDKIQADPRKVKQVLLNLLSNAVKFAPEGGRIDVRAALVDGTVEIAVTDTGVGIAPEDQEAVFEEFRQVGQSDKKAEGTGLGLALCRKFVELHGGRIWVQSQLGVGSTFTFTIPERRGP